MEEAAGSEHIPFKNAQAKLGRAREQIDAYEEEVESFMNDPDDPAANVVARIDEETGDLVFLLKVHKGIPLRFGVMLGEIIHNLRSALDNLLWELPPSPGKSRPDIAQYPLCDREEWFDSQREKERSGWIRADDREIIRRIQPFSTPGEGVHPLSALRALSNQDKHRVVHTISTVADITPEPVAEYAASGMAKAAQTLVINRGEPIQDGTVLVRISFEDDGLKTLGVEAVGNPPHFQMGMMLGSDPKVPGGMLPSMADFVQGIIKTFVGAHTPTPGGAEQ